MKEFIFGGLIAIWLIFIGLSSVSTLYAILTLVFPIIIGGILYNVYLLKKIMVKKILMNHTSHHANY